MIWITFKAHGHKAFTQKISFIMEENIMRKHKRLAAILTASLLAITPCVSAGMMYASADDSQLTISNPEGDTSVHAYKAYQIITGTKADDNTLSNMHWGANINSEKFIAALKANTTLDLTLSDEPSIEEVAAALEDIREEADKVKALSKIFDAEGTDSVLTGDPTALTAGTAATVSDGWYLIKDESTLDEVNGPKVRSANLLQIVGDTSITAKHSLPSIDKVIVEGEDELDANTGAVGDVVEYKIKSAVPDVRGYDKYFFFIDDRLSKGLTFESTDKDAFKVQINGANAPADTYTVTWDDDAKTFRLVFKNCVTNFAGKAGQSIVVTYQATINDDVDVSKIGNTNESMLTYSNDPKLTSDGNGTEHPDEPDDDDPVGETPWDKVVTYSTQLELTKVDVSGDILKGAEFTLKAKDGSDMLSLVAAVTFTEAADGEYYLLKDGTYTKTVPVTGEGGNADKYQDTETKYKRSTTFTRVKNESGVDAIKGMVQDDGTITFKGLKPGDYTLSETKTPKGYNTVSDINFTISAEASLTSCTWSLEGITNPAVKNISVTQGTNETDSKIAFSIENLKGSILPTTGGIGTKLFYLFGGMLAVGSGVVLVTKKRMANIEK
jgi:fimbrial isopeptide formation D2 family protein/LPXTG-motif cell wall-anchored protein